MGYTHYWDRPQTISPEIFCAITADFLRLLPVLTRAGVELANPHGYELPEITSEFIGFNGPVHCAHAKNPAVSIPWPAPRAQSIGSNEDLTRGTLPHRCCNGDCSYESFWFPRCADASSLHGNVCGSCKTAFRPYDLAVTAFLLIARHHLGTSVAVSSDGEPAQWEEARLLCRWELGYGSGYRLGANRALMRETS